MTSEVSAAWVDEVVVARPDVTTALAEAAALTSRGASAPLPPAALRQAMVTGRSVHDGRWDAQLRMFLHESPMLVVLACVHQIRLEHGLTVAAVWRNLCALARAVHSHYWLFEPDLGPIWLDVPQTPQPRL